MGFKKGGGGYLPKEKKNMDLTGKVYPQRNTWKEGGRKGFLKWKVSKRKIPDAPNV